MEGVSMTARSVIGIVICTLAVLPTPLRARVCVPPEPTNLGTLDLGVTHRVRGVFFVPSDRSFRDCLHERLGTWIEMAKRFFAEEMRAAGYFDALGSGKTFRYETDADGRWDVVYMIGEHEAAWYQSSSGYPGGAALDEMYRRLPAQFHRDNVVVYMYDLAVVDGDHLLYTGQGGAAAPWEGEGAGYVLQGSHFLGVGFDTVAVCTGAQALLFEQTQSSGLKDYDGDGALHILTRGQYASTDIGAAIHELGHAFYLDHDFTDYDGDGIETNLMGNGFRRLSGRYTPAGYLPPTALGSLSAAALDGALMFNQACSDADADSVCDADDICPGFNEGEDADCDGIPGGCDPCPFDADNDVDADGLCGDIDNCPLVFNTGQEDADADGVGDVCDPCNNVGGAQEISVRPKVVLRHINTDLDPANDGMAITGKFALGQGATFSGLAPDIDGARVVIESSDRRALVDVTLGGGAFDGSSGWKKNRQGTRWVFLDKRQPAVNNGIAKLALRDRGREAPGRVAVRVRGRNGHYPAGFGDGPIQAIVVVGDGAAGECGETSFESDDCRFNRSGTTLRCAVN
jgi:hypothetical protein